MMIKVAEVDRELAAQQHLLRGGGYAAAERYRQGVYDEEPEVQVIAEFRIARIEEWASELFHHIKHGDQEHQDWLENEIKNKVNALKR